MTAGMKKVGSNVAFGARCRLDMLTAFNHARYDRNDIIKLRPAINFTLK